MCVHGEVNDIQAHAKIVAGPKKTALVSGAWPLPGLCDPYMRAPTLKSKPSRYRLAPS